MVSGELYQAGDPELVESRTRARRLTALYNATAPDDQEGRRHVEERSAEQCIHVEEAIWKLLRVR